MTFQAEIDPQLTSKICAWGGFVITMVMALCLPVRCFMLLMIPQLFSGKGRMFLLMYALFLVMNHPVRNVHRNVTIMSQSTTCGQEMALNQTKELVKAAVAPIGAVIDSIEKVLERLKTFTKFLRDTYAGLRRCVTEIGAVIERAAEWLRSIKDVCNEQIGYPYRKCIKLFDNAEARCRAIGFGFACGAVGSFDFLCSVVKAGQLLCIVADAVRKLLESAVERPAKKLLATASEMFYFNVTMNFKFNYTITQSKSYKEVKYAIHRDIQSRMDDFTKAVGIINNIMFLTFTFVVVKALIYRHLWLTNDRYDNRYITFTVLDLEERRTMVRKKGIMPLLFEEQFRYVESVDWRMVVGEVRRLTTGFLFFILSISNAAFYLFCDYGLYTVLSLIRKHFKVLKDAPIPPHTKLKVIGKGPMADIYRSMVTMFDPISFYNIKLDVTKCVPIPSEPNWNIYRQICIIYFVCLILLITEAYGLRLRHIIMACYYPKRDRMRALWLFNHILKTRGPLMDHVKNRLKNRKGPLNVANISVKGRLAASFPFLERLFKWCGWEVKNCLYCGREGKPDDYTNFIHCAFIDCDGTYCVECYADLNNVCAACNNTVELIESTSEELDSSLSETERNIKEIQKKVRDRKIQQLQEARRPSKIIEDFKLTLDCREGDTLEEVLYGTSSSGTTSGSSSSGTTSGKSSSETSSGTSSSRTCSEKSKENSDDDNRRAFSNVQDEMKYTLAKRLEGPRGKSSSNTSETSTLSSKQIIIHGSDRGQFSSVIGEMEVKLAGVLEKRKKQSSTETSSISTFSEPSHSRYEAGIRQADAHVIQIEESESETSDSDVDTTSQSRSIDSEHESSDEEITERRRYMNKQNNARPYRSRIPYVQKLNYPSLLRRRMNVIRGNTSSNAGTFIQTPDEADSDTDMEDIASVSSVDTADLDFEYQSQKDMDSDYSSDDGLTRRRASRNLDLATYDIFGSNGEDTDSDENSGDYSDASELMEPSEIVISRQ